jgi:predicted RNase H-like nuclease
MRDLRPQTPDLPTPDGEAPVAIGADGVPGGWVVAVCRVEAVAWERATAAGDLPEPAARRVDLRRCANVAEIAEMREGTAPVAIDVPLGIPEDGGARPCDREARALLGKRASSVFNPPGRYLFPALEKATAKDRWQEINRLQAERHRADPSAEVIKVSRQTAGILDKVADADGYLRANPEAAAWLLECHPELSFLRLNAGNQLAPKSKARGALERLTLLGTEFPGIADRLRKDPLAAEIPLADALDAHAALWTALRVASGALDPERNALGRGSDGHFPVFDGSPARIVT